MKPDIQKILNAIDERYGEWHEILFNTSGESFIIDVGQDIVKDFKTLDDLYKWVNEPTCKHVETECNCKEVS